MPRPVYIVCSRFGSLDQYTNTISCFHLIEGLDIARATPPGQGEGIALRIVAAWLQEPDDAPDQVFEAQIMVLFYSSEGSQPIAAAPFDPFTFSKPIHRCVVPEIRFPGFPGPGLLVIEGKVRRVGQEDWIGVQTYPILLRAMEKAESPQEPAPAPPEQESPET